MSRRMAVAAVAPLAFAVLPAIADPDDQAAADGAVAIFNERLAAAGWTSSGPFTQTDSAPEDDESRYGACLGGFEHFLDYTDFEGETARAFSDEFELAGEDETDSAGYAGAVVLTAEESAVAVLDDFVTALGAEETVPCMTDQLAGEDFAEDEPTLEIDVTNASDLGIGEASARLDMTWAVDYEGIAFESLATFAASRVDRSLVIVVAGTTDGGAGDLDPIAELEAMVDSFG